MSAGKALLACAALLALSGAALPETAPSFAPDERFKADVLLVIAHPDDDVVVGGYLARLSYDDHRRIAVIYCTSGDGGGNAVGNEAGAALGQMRTVEARRAMHFLGIENVWFLGAHDTPGQNVLGSLDNWNHGRILDEMVRLVRLTRPEVILTWLPAYVVGENHGDHQAAGVIATEAFDLAGDPTQFPEQVTAARDRTGMANLNEGLLPWQTKKLYYFTDAYEDFGPYWHNPQQLSPYRKNFLDGQGPEYPNNAMSPSQKKSYARLTAELQTYYLTQEGSLGTDALAKKELKEFEYPNRLLFGKSLVESSRTADIFAGITPQPAAFHRVPGYQPEERAGVTVELGGPWRYYTQFRKAHEIENVSQFLPVPEASIVGGQILQIPVVVHNQTDAPVELSLKPMLPSGWIDKTRYDKVAVGPRQSFVLQTRVAAPATQTGQWQEIAWQVEGGGKPASATLRVYVEKGGGLPQ